MKRKDQPSGSLVLGLFLGSLLWGIAHAANLVSTAWPGVIALGAGWGLYFARLQRDAQSDKR